MSKSLYFLHKLTYSEVRRQGVNMGQFTTMVNNTYSVWMLENYNGQEVIVLIYEGDREIAGILHAKTGKILYLHPRSIDGALKICGIQ